MIRVKYTIYPSNLIYAKIVIEIYQEGIIIKDVATLLNIILYNFADCSILDTGTETDEVTYRTVA